MATKVVGPQPAVLAAPNRYGWDEPELQPKQQHRFICNFPVYMPRGIITDAKELVGIMQAGSTSVILTKLKTYPNKRGRTDAQLLVAAAQEDPGNAISQAAGSHPDVQTAENDFFGDSAKATAFSVWWGSAAAQPLAFDGSRYIYRRVSPYVVSRFTPPSYGVNLQTQAIAASPAITSNDPLKNTGKMESAQITLVSTLQDDLHFSLNFLYNLFAPSVVEGVAPTVKPYLFPRMLWTNDNTKYLTVLDMGAWPEVQRRPHEKLGGSAKFFRSTPVGMHKFMNPFISGISFSEYSYQGEALLEATVTLSPSSTAFDFYSYETYIQNEDKGGDTRYGRYSGLYKNDDGGIAGDPNSPLAKQQKAITEAYAEFPTFYSAVSSGRMKKALRDKIIAESKGPEAFATRRRDFINDVMKRDAAEGGPRNGSRVDPRLGNLRPLWAPLPAMAGTFDEYAVDEALTPRPGEPGFDATLDRGSPGGFNPLNPLATPSSLDMRTVLNRSGLGPVPGEPRQRDLPAHVPGHGAPTTPGSSVLGAGTSPSNPSPPVPPADPNQGTGG